MQVKTRKVREKSNSISRDIVEDSRMQRHSPPPILVAIQDRTHIISRPTHSFKTLGGVPVHYARPPVAQYGSRGKPHTFYCEAGFQKQLDSMFDELWLKCPFGKAEVITSAGAFVEKPGQHGKGRALDIDGIFWAERDFVTLRYPKDTKFYLGVEAILKKHFGTVLDYNYNKDHHDHFHVDNGSNVGFGPSKQTTAFSSEPPSRMSSDLT